MASYASSLELYRSSAGKKRGSELLQTAGALVSYCATHRLDPDNSLIGLCPSSRAFGSCIEEERAAMATSGAATLTKAKKVTVAEGDLVLVEQTSVSDAPPEVRLPSKSIFQDMSAYGHVGSVAFCTSGTQLCRWR
jgi:hypothetical protein